ncbi:MAG TPA: hypothetical protein VJ747_09080 [Stellaceae bacterium]|nr:hypothetical protein [Stellaceae bacterium]
MTASLIMHRRRNIYPCALQYKTAPFPLLVADSLYLRATWRSASGSAGQSVYEGPDDGHAAARNASATEPAEFDVALPAK